MNKVSLNVRRMDGTSWTQVNALDRSPGRWASRPKSFRIEVPCDNSCDNSWPFGRYHGHSRSVEQWERSPPERQNRRSEAPDLRFSWWPGAGSNRRPSDFQGETPGPHMPDALSRLILCQRDADVTEAASDRTTAPASQSSRCVWAHPWAPMAHACPVLSDTEQQQRFPLQCSRSPG